MKKHFGKKIIILLVGLLVCITGLLTLLAFTDANRFKPLIVDRIQQTTGLHLAIDGDLSWSLVPHLGFKVGHLVIQDPHKAKSNLAEVKSLSLGFQLLPLLQGKIQLDSIKAQELVIYLNKKAVKLSISVAGHGYLDLITKTLKLTQIDGEINNLKVQGEVTVSNSNEKLQALGNFKIQSSDFKKWLQEAGIQSPALQALTQVSGAFDFSSQASFKSLQINGNLQAKELKISSLSTKNLSTAVQLKEGHLTLSPLKSELYEGRLEGKAKIDLNKAEPQIYLQAALRDIEAKSLLADLDSNSKIKFTGKGNLNFELNTAGASAPSLTRNLNGSGNLNFNNGSISGIDMVYMVFTAYALINHQAPPAKSSNDTEFGGLSASFSIRNGLISNQDLKLTTSLLAAGGKGTVDLVSRKINYQILAATKQSSSQTQESSAANLLGFVLPLNNITSLNTLSIPILISGSIDKPHVFLDMKTLIAEVAKSQIKSTISQEIGGTFLEVVPGLQVLPLLQSLPTK